MVAGNSDSLVAPIDGFVIFVDIVGYSLKKADEQLQCATHLMKDTEESAAYKKLGADSGFRYANTTGDGFVVVCGGGTIGGQPHLILDFLHRILKIAQNFGETKVAKRHGWRMEVRCGVHKGSFFQNCQAFGATTALGSGVNIASRVCGLAGASQIIVSERFHEYYLDHASRDSALNQRVFAKPWVARVKHDQPVEVRQYSFVDKKGALLFGNQDRPQAQARVEAVRKLIYQQLAYITSELICHLNDAHEIPQSESRIRLSILEARDGRHLTVTDFRVRHDGRNERRSNAQFSIDPDSPTGTAGYCYVEGRPRALTGLPKDRPGIVAKLETVGLGEEYLQQEQGRDASAYLSVPIGCEVSGRRIVVSIDLKHPLWPEDDTRLVGLLDVLRKYCERIVAPAWDLWMTM